MQQTLEHRTVPPFSHPMSDMLKIGNQKEIVTIQTPRQPSGFAGFPSIPMVGVAPLFRLAVRRVRTGDLLRSCGTDKTNNFDHFAKLAGKMAKMHFFYG